jgi:hypothetical protein
MDVSIDIAQPLKSVDASMDGAQPLLHILLAVNPVDCLDNMFS